MYERTIDLMDEEVFPRESIYSKKDLGRCYYRISRVIKTDEEIVENVATDMIDSLGEELV